MENNTIDKRIIKYIGQHHVLTLATSDGAMLHCANIFYAYMADLNLFAFTTSVATLHGQHASTNPIIAASIVLETKVIGKVQGLQIRGRMYMPEGDLLTNTKKAYLSRFPYAALMGLELWVIEPTYMKFTDNSLGFGKKIIWPEDCQATKKHDSTEK